MSAKLGVYLLIVLNAINISVIASLNVTTSSKTRDLQYDRYCHYSEYCTQKWDNRSVCVPSLANPDIKQCHCHPNLKFDRSDHTCRPFRCAEDKHCQEWDLKRVCRNGRCECEATYEEHSEYMFLCVHVVYETPTSLLWLWLLFVVPVVAIISVIANNLYKCRTRNRFRY